MKAETFPALTTSDGTPLTDKPMKLPRKKKDYPDGWMENFERVMKSVNTQIADNGSPMSFVADQLAEHGIRCTPDELRGALFAMDFKMATRMSDAEGGFNGIANWIVYPKIAKPKRTKK